MDLGRSLTLTKVVAPLGGDYQMYRSAFHDGKANLLPHNTIIDRLRRSIWLSVLRIINLIVRTVIIYYNDNQSKKTHCIWQVVYKRHRMLVRQPLHDALLVNADIHNKDEKGVRSCPWTRSGWALQRKIQRRLKREEKDHHSLTTLET